MAQIITFGTMAARGGIRDVGRVMGMDYQKVDKVAKAIPMELHMTCLLYTSDVAALAKTGHARTGEVDKAVAQTGNLQKGLDVSVLAVADNI